MSFFNLNAATAQARGEAQFVSGNEQATSAATPAEPKPRGRRRVHATPAAKVAAHRAKGKRIDYLDSERIHDAIASLAEQFDCSKNDVVKSLVRFALTNRNWRQQGLYRLKGGEQ